MPIQPISRQQFIAILIMALFLILVFGILSAAGEDFQPWAYLPVIMRDWVPTPTRSPYPFTMDDDSPTNTLNFANSAGCNWLGVAGQVFDLDKEGNQGSQIWQGRINRGETVKITAPHGRFNYDYTYQPGENQPLSGGSARWCNNNLTIQVP